jgi:hypothetical protein
MQNKTFFTFVATAWLGLGIAFLFSHEQTNALICIGISGIFVVGGVICDEFDSIKLNKEKKK